MCTHLKIPLQENFEGKLCKAHLKRGGGGGGMAICRTYHISLSNKK
jgi:hypothetical protein